MAPGPLPEQADFQDTAILWAWLAEPGRSESIEFVPGAYWSAVWNEQIRESNKAQILERLTGAKDLDLVIAMGTWAGQDLTGKDLPVAVEVCSASDPVDAGIVASATDSGRDNVHAHVDQGLVEAQIRLFHQVAGFKRLGMFFEDTDAGRRYAGLDVVQTLAGELGFAVIQCHTVDDSMDQELSEQSVMACAETLAGDADAVYLTDQNGLTLPVLPQVLDVLYAAHAATFIQTNLGEVRAGRDLRAVRGRLPVPGPVPRLVHGQDIQRGQAPRPATGPARAGQAGGQPGGGPAHRVRSAPGYPPERRRAVRPHGALRLPQP